MVEVLFFIGLISIVGVVISAFMRQSEAKNEIPYSGKIHKIEDDVISLGSFAAHQYIEDNRFDFTRNIEYDDADKITIICIDGRKASIKMLLSPILMRVFVDTLNKAVSWDTKATQAELTANKLIGIINTDVSVIVGDEIYYSENSSINFTFFCTENAESSLMIASNKYDIGGAVVPASVIFITIEEVKNIIFLLSDEKRESSLLEREEVDKILN